MRRRIMARVYNFSAGPAVLPEEVLREAAQEMLDYKGSGMSVMEMSHRSKTYDTIIKEAEADLRELMNIPDNYKVLRFTVRRLKSPLRRIRPFLISRTAAICPFRRMRTMSIFVKTIPFTEPSSKPFRTPRDILW